MCMYVYIRTSLGQNDDDCLLSAYYMLDFGALTYVLSFG